MYKIAIWGTGSIYNRYINAVKLQEIRGGGYWRSIYYG